MSLNFMNFAPPPPHEQAGGEPEQGPSQPNMGHEQGHNSSDDNWGHHCPRRGGHHNPRGFGLGHRGGPHHHHHHHPDLEHGPGFPPFFFDESYSGPFGGPFGGRGGRGGMFGRGGHHHRGFNHGHHRGGRGGMHRPPFGGPFGPDGLQGFLGRLATELGNGFEEFLPTESGARGVNDENQTDFEPCADVFDTANEYIVHVSLPGAQKPDISVNYDVQESTLRLAGVIHRPELNEELHEAMVIDERRRDVGVFERSIKLSSRNGEIVHVDEENISAKLVDGVLIVRLPKVQEQTQEPQHNKRVTINEDIEIEGMAPNEENLYDAENDSGVAPRNEKQASVVEVQDEMDAMHIENEAELSDELPEDDDTLCVVSQASDEEANGAVADYVKVEVK